MAKVYSLLAIGARSVVVMRQLLLVTQRWNHHDSIVHNGLQTNNHLESYNRKWNLLADKSSNIWAIQELFVKQEADAEELFFLTQLARTAATILVERRSHLTIEQR